MINVELGDEMLTQIEALSGAPTEEYNSRSLKFDGKGTMHVMYRDGDDKLVHDTAIKTMEIETSYKDELRHEQDTYGSKLIAQSKRLNRIFIFFMAMLGALLVLSILIVQSVR